MPNVKSPCPAATAGRIQSRWDHLAPCALSARRPLAALACLLALVPVAAAQETPRPLRVAQTASTPIPVATDAKAAVVPKPGIPTKEEADYLAGLDKAIAPLTNLTLSKEELGLLRDAVKAIAAAKPSTALELRSKLTSPVAQKIVDWYGLTRGYGTPQDYERFLDKNPAWPSRSLLVQRMEEAFFTQGGAAATIRAHFAKSPPETGAGLAALASAHLAEGNEAEAKPLAARAWRELGIPASLETGFLERFGKLLTPSDHRWRLDKLIIDDVRWKSGREARAAFVKRLIPLLAEKEQKKAKARLAVFLRSSGSKAQVEALPAEETPDWGVVFHRVQALRRAGQLTSAAKLLLGAPTEEAKIVSPDAWWEERRDTAYLALKAGKPKLAYELVAEAGPLTINPLKEQRFTAGWIALRYLKDPALAEPHFQAFKNATDGPLSRSKANYWLGRVVEAKGDAAAARSHYEAATADLDTFHGLLAQQKLSPGAQPLAIKPPAVPDDALVVKFNADDAVQAAVLARRADLEANILRSFIVHLKSVFDSEAGQALVAHLAEALGDTQMAVRTGKTAIAAGRNLLYYAYPVHTFPSYEPLRKPPETAFLLGIARQETEFNRLIVSGAGAKGLLQVMTVTAKHICRDYKIKCNIPRLISDPSYNARIASAYVGDRLEDFRGSYVLTLAGYNAGPGRARQWIREFGDPRDPKVDPIDWIERIPFKETREYLAKVLANVQIYRARLGESRPALRLEEDLGLTRAAEAPKPALKKETGTTSANSDG